MRTYCALRLRLKKRGGGGGPNKKWSLPSVFERRWRLTRYSLDVYSERQDRGQRNPEVGSRWCERCQSFSEEVTLSWVLKICRSRRKVGDRGTKPLLGEGLAGTKALQWGTPESAESSRQSGMATACSRSMHAPRDKPGGNNRRCNLQCKLLRNCSQAWQPTEPQIGLNLLDSTHRDFPTISPTSWMYNMELRTLIFISFLVCLYSF